MRVVVTGATGNIGTSVVRALGTDDRVDQVLGVSGRIPEWKPAKTIFVATDVRSPEIGTLAAAASTHCARCWTGWRTAQEVLLHHCDRRETEC